MEFYLTTKLLWTTYTYNKMVEPKNKTLCWVEEPKEKNTTYFMVSLM